ESRAIAAGMSRKARGPVMPIRGRIRCNGRGGWRAKRQHESFQTRCPARLAPYDGAVRPLKASDSAAVGIQRWKFVGLETNVLRETCQVPEISIKSYTRRAGLCGSIGGISRHQGAAVATPVVLAEANGRDHARPGRWSMKQAIGVRLLP